MNSLRWIKGFLFLLLTLGAVVVRKCSLLDAFSSSVTFKTPISRFDSVVETSEELQQYPRVFIIPIPPELHWGLLNCSLASSKVTDEKERRKQFWFVDDNAAVRFQESTPKEPFGKPVQHPSLTYHYTPSHPFSDAGEYDFQAYFYRMIQGYFNRVDSPDLADLFYVPFFASYNRRFKCHPKGPDWASKHIHSHVEWYMRKYPSKAGAANFFTASGNVCSCNAKGVVNECLPIRAWEAHDLARQFKVLAWERHANRPEKESNLVVPYVTQLHDTPWAVETTTREMLVLGIVGSRTKDVCVHCGPCNHPTGKDTKQCLPQCSSIRKEIIEHMRIHKRDNDIALWTNTDNPSTTWFPNGTQFWPPVQTLDKMMLSTFCLQPAGDTLSRKSFFESIQTGCIPVVFRNDDEYLEQLPFSGIIPYREIYYYIPESCVVKETCFIETNTGTLLPSKSFIDVLRSVPQEAILKRRQLIKQYGRMLLFSAHDGVDGGYNDVSDPDAFLMSLQEAWRLAQV